MDIECYVNYFLVMFRRVDKDVVRYYEQFDGQKLNIAEIKHILRSTRWSRSTATAMTCAF